MELVRYRPGRQMREFGEQLNRLFGDWPAGLMDDVSTVEASQWAPAVDIREEEGRFIIEADIPGVDPSAIEVTMERGTLAIRGERRQESTVDKNSVRRVERAYGMFYRRFALPDTADPEAIQARGDNGVLHIEIGKRESARSRRIPVEQ